MEPRSPELRLPPQQRSPKVVVGACKGARGGSQSAAASPPTPAASPGAPLAQGAERAGGAALPAPRLPRIPSLCAAGPPPAAVPPTRPAGAGTHHGHPASPARPSRCPLRSRRLLPPQGRQQRGEAAAQPPSTPDGRSLPPSRPRGGGEAADTSPAPPSPSAPGPAPALPALSAPPSAPRPAPVPLSVRRELEGNLIVDALGGKLLRW